MLTSLFIAWMSHTPGGRGPAVPPELEPASEGFVMFTLATLFFTLGCFVTWMVFIWRRSVNPPPHVRLIMEVQEEEASREQRQPAAEDAPPQPWEKNADWWRKPGDGGAA
jgi:hypothetical protein